MRASAWVSVLVPVLGLGLGTGACKGGGQKLDVKKIDASVKPPANVALYVKIAREGGEPVTLIADDFAVYEDGKLVKKAKRALLPVNQAVDRFTMIALDFSGPLVDSEYLPILLEAVDGIVGKVGKQSRVGVAGFDGEGLMVFVGFEDEDPQAGLQGLHKFRPRGRNVDLWGSFIAALDAVEDAMSKSPLRHRQASLILVTDRRDKAQRLSPDQVSARIKKSTADVFVVGVGPEVSRDELEPLGKTGSYFVPHASEVDKPFAQLSERLEGKLLQDYLFSYCSPKRKGKHEVELRIISPRWKGSVEHQFSAKGFGKQCDPKMVPDFAAEGAAPEEGGEEGEAETKPKKKKKAKADEEAGAAETES
jgi:hypothetical protein